jgi:iron(III) transport system ATP-binding protein
LDEPFAALNDELRERLGQHVRAHIKESGACAMLVTHHASDAEALADRILRMPTLTK